MDNNTNNDLTVFLKNTEKALKNHTVQELNDAVSDFLKNREEKKAEVDIVLELVANQYCISKRILRNSVARGKIQIARRMAYCLLHFDLNLTTRYISKRIFLKWQNSIMDGIKYYKRIDLAIKQDKEFMDTYLLLQQKLTKKIAK